MELAFQQFVKVTWWSSLGDKGVQTPPRVCIDLGPISRFKKIIFAYFVQNILFRGELIHTPHLFKCTLFFLVMWNYMITLFIVWGKKCMKGNFVIVHEWRQKNKKRSVLGQRGSVKINFIFRVSVKDQLNCKMVKDIYKRNIQLCFKKLIKKKNFASKIKLKVGCFINVFTNIFGYAKQNERYRSFFGIPKQVPNQSVSKCIGLYPLYCTHRSL